MGQQDIIDIERLREAVPWLAEYAAVLAVRDDMLLAPLEEVEAAARFLVSLADQGGELWMEKPCKHGLLRKHPTNFWDGVEIKCDGGSRVRVWPKEDA